MSVFRQNLDDAHHAQLGHIEKARKPFILHQRATNTVELHPAQRLEPCHQRRAKPVSRRLTSDQENPHHMDRETRNIPAFSTASIVDLRSRIITRPASTTSPAKPASATFATVSGPMAGISTRRS